MTWVDLPNLPDLPVRSGNSGTKGPLLPDLPVRLLENHGTKGPLLPDLPVRLLENHGTKGPLLPDLPVELLCLVAQSLPLRSIVRFRRVCNRFYGIFRSLVIKRLAKMPWSITVDFRVIAVITSISIRCGLNLGGFPMDIYAHHPLLNWSWIFMNFVMFV